MTKLENSVDKKKLAKRAREFAMIGLLARINDLTASIMYTNSSEKMTVDERIKLRDELRLRILRDMGLAKEDKP